MSTRFFTNDGDNTLLKKFAGVFEHNPDIERFDALVGYLRASGYSRCGRIWKRCRTSAFWSASTWIRSWRNITGTSARSWKRLDMRSVSGKVTPNPSRRMKKKPARKKVTPLYRQKPLTRKKPLQRRQPFGEQWQGNDSCVLREEPAPAVRRRALHCVELFAGAGGLAIAAWNAGFEHDAVLEYNHDACETIRANQRRGYELVRHWPLIEGDVHDQDFQTWNGRVDLVSGGPPCQPFSIGGKHGAMGDRRNLFPEAARAVREIGPRVFAKYFRLNRRSLQCDLN